MSLVTNVILTTFLNDEDAVATVNESLKAQPTMSGHDVLHPVHDHGSNRKAMEADVYIGAFNYLDLDGLLQAVRSAPWEWPDYVRVFVQQQDDDGFSERLGRPMPRRRG